MRARPRGVRRSITGCTATTFEHLTDTSFCMRAIFHVKSPVYRGGSKCVLNNSESLPTYLQKGSQKQPISRVLYPDARFVYKSRSFELILSKLKKATHFLIKSHPCFWSLIKSHPCFWSWIPWIFSKTHQKNAT